MQSLQKAFSLFQVHAKRDLSPRYKEIFIDFEPNPNQESPQPSPKCKRPLHKTLSEGEILLERRRIQHSDYIERVRITRGAYSLI